MTLYSLFNQTVSADKIILWISDEYELSDLPYSISKYIKKGLEIRFVKDKGLYTPNVYALKEYNDSLIVVAESGIIYPNNWLEKLYHSYIANPNDIHVHKAEEVKIQNETILSVKEWIHFVDNEIASYKFVPIITGGILYPPKCFVSDIFRDDIYNKKSGILWNYWCWIMAVISNRKIRVVKNHIKHFDCFDMFKRLKSVFFKLKNYSKYDSSIQLVIEYYKQNVFNKLRND